MAEVLEITVNGSCEPIVNAGKSADYDRVFFVYSTGERYEKILLEHMN